MFANHDSDRTEQVGMKSLDGCKDGLVLQQRAPHTLRCWLSLPFEGAGFHPQSLACVPGMPCAACWRGSPGFSGSYAVEACRGLACSPHRHRRDSPRAAEPPVLLPLASSDATPTRAR